MNPATDSRALTLATYVTVAAMLAILAYQLAGRVIFPWDKLLWCESPFLTDMLKLAEGRPIFGDPDDANSFVYSPGIAYLTFALLKPFGLHLELPFIRMVSIGIALVAAVIMGRLMARAIPASSRARSFVPVASGVSFLVLAQNWNVDIPHPDNLQILHAVATFAICLTALDSKDFRLALGAAAFAGLGILTKQSGALVLVATVLALVAGRQWSVRQYALIGLVGMVSLGVSALPVAATENARFHAFEVIAGHSVDLGRYVREFPDVFLSYPHRVLLLAIFAVVLVRSSRTGFTTWQRTWACFAICLLPAQVVAFAKDGAGANSWTMIDAFLLLYTWPLIASRGPITGRGWAAIALVLALLPVKEIPDAHDLRYNAEIEARIAADLREGKRVLLAHGTSSLIRAGHDGVPLDRANSIYETLYAGMPRTDGIERRIRELYYDRIYVDVDLSWYGLPVAELLSSYYLLVDEIDGPRRRHEDYIHLLPFWHPYMRHGYQTNINQDSTFVLEPRDPGGSF